MKIKEFFGFIKVFAICFAISIFLEIVANAIESNLLIEFLKSNILTLLLALLAINAATLGVTVSKIQEIVAKYEGINFKESIQEMLFSLKEQIALIVITTIILVIEGSKVLVFQYKDLVCHSIIYAVFFHSIHILWDTAKSVFVIIEISDKLKNLKK
ncbi:hypothetical protein MYRA21_2775 [Myroides sp. A21]|uniref:hypothetical protein n=1 Tax=Myroides sp. A21 TaxID=1583100 RepID=UPI00058624DC|nr:hypothetical protein [Myroides sp. A21]AJA69884.1 hypothetical protein MYRA21_2775 [Myroides sp. A21]